MILRKEFQIWFLFIKKNDLKKRILHLIFLFIKKNDFKEIILDLIFYLLYRMI